MAKSRAEARFEQIVNDANPVKYLRSLVRSTPPTFEDESREFKVGSLLDDKLREIWSESLSCFANTEGGVLIFGIHAKNDPTTGVDAANKIDHVPNPAKTKTRLMQLQLEATNPPVSGVKIHDLVDPAGKDGAGFVVCLIPESPQKPHRAEYPDRQYYIRVLDKCVVPVPSLLRDLFHPRSNPYLQVQVKPRKYRTSKDDFVVTFDVFISNAGNGTAHDAYIDLKANLQVVDWNDENVRDFTRIKGQIGVRFVANKAIHPDSLAHVASIRSTFASQEQYHSSKHPYYVPVIASSFSLRFAIYSTDAAAQVQEFFYTADEIEEEVAKGFVAGDQK